MVSPIRAALFACLALSACVEPPLALPAPVDDVLTLDDFVSRYRDEICLRRLYCESRRHVSAWWEAAPELSCREVVDGREGHFAPDPYQDEVARGAARGTLVFDPVRGAACLDALARTCSLGEAMLRACEGAILGTLPVGSDCRSVFECVPGAFCASDSVLRCDGVCTELPPAGGPCALGCDHCDAEVCGYYAPTVVRRVGERCGTERTSTGELRHTECSGELVCQPPHCDDEFALNCPSLCELLPREGEPCGANPVSSCAPTLACVDGTCTRMIVQTVAGAPCEEPHVLCDRFHRLLCEDGQCVQMEGGEGAACTGTWDAIDCDPGLNCDLGSFTCIASGPDVQPCIEGAECESGACWAGRCQTEPECPE